MDKPCCKGVVRDADGLKGRDFKLNDGKLNVYVCGDEGGDGNGDEAKSTPKAGVIVVYDIFGGGIPNCKFIVDHLAANGYLAILPDFYAAQGIDAWQDETTLGTDEFGKWFGSVTSEEYWSSFKSDLEVAKKWLSDKGCQKVGTVGFCHGGKASCGIAATTSFIDACVSHHGAGHNGDDVTNAKCPQLFTSVEGDAYFNADAHKAVREAIAADEKKRNVSELVVYGDGAYHGFVVRGDWVGNKKVKEQADDAMQRTVAFFDKHLK